ncbi:GNAT family N-acetyltransferase [Microbacterium sp. Root61]|uniref:GNAT family N-acetyltransferase n=1 Tax=Microbacterium sp. Root61 TaxID=1736570 RepID=UPI000A668F75|nr:GNAT family N-acetyltransferase [Microbacterium sp. Root61]
MMDATVQVRAFQPGDGPRIADAWTAAAPQDPITATRFRDLILLDRNFDPEGLFVADRDGEVVGAAYVVRRRVAHDGDDLEPGRGWIPFFFVRPDARRQSLGRELLNRGLEWLRDEGVTEVVFSSYTPNYVLPGLDADRYPEAAALLASLGFEIIEQPSSMEMSLRGYRLPESASEHAARLRAEGWYLGTLLDEDIVPLIELAGREFNSDWARAIREGIVSGLPLERIMVARNPDGRLIGWAMHGTYDDVIDRFGPFGVLPESRGTGLGRLLLHLTLERMSAVQAHAAWFLWADEGSAASNLYVKTGFEITRTFTILRADISWEGKNA